LITGFPFVIITSVYDSYNEEFPCAFKSIFVSEIKRSFAMTARKMVFGLVTCLLLAVLIEPSPAQVRRQSGAVDRTPIGPPQVSPEQWQRQMQAEAAERSRQLAAEREQRRIQMLKNMQQSSREAERQRDASIKQALGATDQQWEAIFPRFDKVRTIMRQARYSLATIGYSSGSIRGPVLAEGPMLVERPEAVQA
jgi:hypothetical protein